MFACIHIHLYSISLRDTLYSHIFHTYEDTRLRTMSATSVPHILEIQDCAHWYAWPLIPASLSVHLCVYIMNLSIDICICIYRCMYTCIYRERYIDRNRCVYTCI